ncbi:MAG: amphi-Trp domain-containing protein [Deltaproteobacteria bacterium]|jgi:amphi-Trp domain-containing protein|nr:amphi-Trp domain-containing protein [Deltaproteobacteria bacterium]
MRKNRFQYQFVTDPQDVARYLESLVASFNAGELRLTEKNRQIVFKPGPIMELAIDAQRRQGRAVISLTISWEESRASKNLTLPFDDLNGEPSKEDPDPDQKTDEADDPSV